MNARPLLGVLAPIVLLSAGCGSPEASAATVVAATPDGLSISGPHGHDNLQVWLVHGPDRLDAGRELVPLEEALARELVVVHETGEVGELAIENVAADVDVFVQSGDIVQGGKQDRTIGVDLVLAPGSGRVPLPSFCVEQGRWNARGLAAQASQIFDNSAVDTVHALLDGAAPAAASQSAAVFLLCKNNVSTNALRKAVLVDGDQDEVWREVAATQGKLASVADASGLGQAVDPSSPTSLELTLNTEAVQQARAEYVAALADVAAAAGDDAIGCVVAINGRLDSADVYGSRALFLKMWPKLLRGAATAAVAVRDDGAGHGGGHAVPGVSADHVCRYLSAPQGERSERQVADADVVMAVGATDYNHVVESRTGGQVLHRAWLTR